MNYIYVLKLQNNKWYIGYTDNIKKAFKASLTGSKSSASWVLQNPPICVDLIIKTATKVDERFVTLLYMIDKGWENVRGAGWVTVNLRKPAPLKTIKERKYEKAIRIKRSRVCDAKKRSEQAKYVSNKK